MTGIIASVTGIIILYIKTYEDDEDYYSYPIQAVDQGGNGILVFPQRHWIYKHSIREIHKRQLNGITNNPIEYIIHVYACFVFFKYNLMLFLW